MHQQLFQVPSRPRTLLLSVGFSDNAEDVLIRRLCLEDYIGVWRLLFLCKYFYYNFFGVHAASYTSVQSYAKTVVYSNDWLFSIIAQLVALLSSEVRHRILLRMTTVAFFRAIALMQTFNATLCNVYEGQTTNHFRANQYASNHAALLNIDERPVGCGGMTLLLLVPVP